jgi:hypothetical protein
MPAALENAAASSRIMAGHERSSKNIAVIICAPSPKRNLSRTDIDSDE